MLRKNQSNRKRESAPRQVCDVENTKEVLTSFVLFTQAIAHVTVAAVTSVCCDRLVLVVVVQMVWILNEEVTVHALVR